MSGKTKKPDPKKKDAEPAKEPAKEEKGKKKGGGKKKDAAEGGGAVQYKMPKRATKPKKVEEEVIVPGQKRYPKRKQLFKKKFQHLLDTYQSILVVGIDNVGSKQLQDIRKLLRGKAVLLCGKNTLTVKLINSNLEKKPQLAPLSNLIKKNVAFIFTNEDINEIRTLSLSNRVPAAARAGTEAPNDVFIPAGGTGMDPGQTSFFQALNIPTKIFKGSIEILNEVHLIKKGEKVGASEVGLLAKLNIRPFSYGLTATWAFDDGDLIKADLLDITTESVLSKFMLGVSQMNAISHASGYPIASLIPAYMSAGFRNIASIALAIDYDFKQMKDVKEMIEKGSAVQAAVKEEKPVEKKDEAKKEEKKEEPEEDEDDDIGAGGLFGDEDDE